MATADQKAFDARPVRSFTIQESPRWRPYSPKRRAAPLLVPCSSCRAVGSRKPASCLASASRLKYSNSDW
jgi:hypothetical protein